MLSVCMLFVDGVTGKLNQVSSLLKVQYFLTDMFICIALAKHRSSSGSTPSVCPSIHPSICKTFWVPSLFNDTSFIFYIQTLYIDCSYIEVVRLPFCAHFINVFSFLGVLNIMGVLTFFFPKCVDGV